jgi:hypothetical protein
VTYTPTVWKDETGVGDGTIVTAARLNNIESGIGSAQGIVGPAGPAGPAGAPGGAGGQSFTQQIGDGAARAFAVAHNFGTRAVQVAVYTTATPYSEVTAEVEHDSADTIIVRTSAAQPAPTAGQYTVVVAAPGSTLTSSALMDTWHTVGPQGGAEPAFQNSWVNFGGAPEQVAQFRKDPFGHVSLRGLVKSGTVGQTIFQLPVGYRPPAVIRIPVMSNAVASYGYVLADGSVGIAAGSNISVALETFEFDTDSVSEYGRGPAGPTGVKGDPGYGSSVSVVSALPILDVGMSGQLRAGRTLTVADFTSLGLSQPVGLWNLSDLSNLGSDGRALTNKGAVPLFGAGVTGTSSTCATFVGLTSQALYIPDSGAADPLRIRTGSWGCWFRTAKRGTLQYAVTKYGTTGAFFMRVEASNVVSGGLTFDGSTPVLASGVSDAADDRWHFACASHDGTTLRLYVDGVLEAVTAASGVIFASAAPLNIGGANADGATAAVSPFNGSVDEAFVSADVLAEDQLRSLYCVRLPHTLAVVPASVRLNVTRRRRGGALSAATDFVGAVRRIYNFTAGSLNDEGLDSAALTNNGGALSVAGADGTAAGAYSFAGAQSLSATDTGLPSGTGSPNGRAYGCWFKTTSTTSSGVMGWGTTGTADARLVLLAGGAISCYSGGDAIAGPFIADGQWHLLVVNEYPPGDVARKLYMDGRLVGSSTVINTITLGGTFRLGADPNAGFPVRGQIDGAFVAGSSLSRNDLLALWTKAGQGLGASPKNPGDHVERLSTTDLLWVGDTLDSSHTIDLSVAT